MYGSIQLPGIQDDHTMSKPLAFTGLIYVLSGETGSKHFVKTEKALS